MSEKPADGEKITLETNGVPDPMTPTPEPPLRLTANPFGLNFRERMFVAVLPLTTPPFNATEAYGRAGFKGGRAGRHNAARLLAKPYIHQAIETTYGPRLQQLTMSGEEALERITAFARGVDIRKVFPDEPRIRALSDADAVCVKAVVRTKHGLRIEFYDALQAAMLMAKSAGRLKETLVVERTLEEILAAANELPHATAEHVPHVDPSTGGPTRGTDHER